jgi:hypothetical protein
VPYFRVEIKGDVARGAGLLARAGIQNVVDDAPRTLTARLSAQDGEAAVSRVRAALKGEAFRVEPEARQEQAVQ